MSRMDRAKFMGLRLDLVAEVHEWHAEIQRLSREMAEAQQGLNRAQTGLAGLDQMWRAYFPNVEPPRDDANPPAEAGTPPPQLHAKLEIRTHSTWAQLVRRAVLEAGEEFSTQDIYDKVFAYATDRPNNESNRATISGQVKRMQEANEITLLRRGLGSAPSRYRKINGVNLDSPPRKEVNGAKS